METMILVANVTIKTEGLIREIEYDFLCPNCGRRHWARELTMSTRRPFNTVSHLLGCGCVIIRMPWSPTPERDRKSVYGQV
jgi:hypothetical protein